MTPRRELLIAVVALALTACAGVAADGTGSADPTTPPIVADVGALPGAVSTPAAGDATTIESTSTSTSVPVEQVEARGNRVLMIGDSILASTSRRYGGLMCSTLVPLGWRVAVEAEVSRQISFARAVQRERLAEGWDVGLVFLGTNHGNDPVAYRQELDRVVERFGDMPVVLVNVTQRNNAMTEVNDAIAEVAGRRDNVVVVDWRAMTYVDRSLLNTDGIHPSDRGRQQLVAAVAEVLGQAPPAVGGKPAACLPSRFTDDAEGLPDGLMPTTTVQGGTNKPSSSTTTTTTTAPGGASPSTTNPPSATSTTMAAPGTTVSSVVPSTNAPVTTTPPSTGGSDRPAATDGT
jgi:hypothetical protein